MKKTLHSSSARLLVQLAQLPYLSIIRSEYNIDTLRIEIEPALSNSHIRKPIALVEGPF
jgi:predicted transcriptional regulator